MTEKSFYNSTLSNNDVAILNQPIAVQTVILENPGFLKNTHFLLIIQEHWYNLLNYFINDIGTSLSQHYSCIYQAYLFPVQPIFQILICANEFLYNSKSDDV